MYLVPVLSGPPGSGACRRNSDVTLFSSNGLSSNLNRYASNIDISIPPLPLNHRHEAYVRWLVFKSPIHLMTVGRLYLYLRRRRGGEEKRRGEGGEEARGEERRGDRGRRREEKQRRQSERRGEEG